MSFVKILATLSVGIAAIKGTEKFKTLGGIDGMKSKLAEALPGAGAMADQMSSQMTSMAQSFGMADMQTGLRDMFDKVSAQSKSSGAAAEAGLGAMMSAMTAAATTGAAGLSDMVTTLTKGTPASTMAEDHARLMITAMIQAAKADGSIDAQERAQILDHLGDASDEEIAFVEAQLDAPVDVAALAGQVAQSAKAQVYSAALMVISVDTEAERSYLANLAAAIGLEAEKVLQIHKSMGKPIT
ncbi:hypothetical protein BFP70_00615 [Thioclava sp. SK-1]|uniref:DUF533 domain-containing protein n=1 Tax=Thioclava sp. SK-1 TaxID=1889770 RepID=UPI0008260DC2|nr:DUF533 domain-containing protein [Thioclava sp. SK-1]OCX66696.1 hypothetical protein BFP70_00615 [Thioclava sp. SK-1]